jgi:hypothetical protein
LGKPPRFFFGNKNENTMCEYLYHLLLQVQDDIRQLRENLTNKGDGKGITIEELENALNKTEQGLQVNILIMKEINVLTACCK